MASQLQIEIGQKRTGPKTAAGKPNPAARIRHEDPGLPGLEPALGIIGEAILLEPGEVLSADSTELWFRHFAQLLRQRHQYRHDQSISGGRPRSARVIEIGATKGM